MALPLAKLRLYLSLIPLLRARPGISFKEIGEHLGVSAQAAAREIPDALMLCGVPPYLPHDYIACFTHGDRVTLRFADHFKRPARLTVSEAAAILIALRALPPARGGPMAKEVVGLTRKIEGALGSGDVRKLARRIGGRRGSSALGQRMGVLEKAVDEHREVLMEYYTQSRRSLNRRTVRPYALLDHLGTFYLIARDSLRQKELKFRVDRIREAELLETTFERPRGFSAQRYRRAEIYKPGPGDRAVRVHFASGGARFVREISSPGELKNRADGGVERTVRTENNRWVVDWSLSYGDQAEIVGPPMVRKEAKSVIDDWLAFYKANPK
ncbi:MAG: WYL domain-containing protein [Planctomycetota bacterium]